MDDLIYRPFDHDDWGMIRNADGTMFATVRRPEAYEGEFDQHRAEETDPFAEIARKVIFFDQLEDENATLRSDNARLAKELEEARKALEPFSEYAGLYCSESSDNLPVSDDDFDFIAFLGDFRRAAAIRHKATVTTDDLPEGGSGT